MTKKLKIKSIEEFFKTVESDCTKYLTNIYKDKVTWVPTVQSIIVFAPSTAGKTTVLTSEELAGAKADFKTNYECKSDSGELKEYLITSYFKSDDGRAFSLTDIDTFLKAVIHELSNECSFSKEVSEAAKSYTLTDFYVNSNVEFAKIQWQLEQGEVELQPLILFYLAMAVGMMVPQTCFLMATRENMNLTTWMHPVYKSNILVTPLEAETMYERQKRRDNVDRGLQHYVDYAGTIANYYASAFAVLPIHKDKYLKDVLDALFAELWDNPKGANANENESRNFKS